MHIFLASVHAVQGSIITSKSWGNTRSASILDHTSASSKPQDNNYLTSYQIRRYLGPVAATNAKVIQCVPHIFNQSFGFRPDGGRPYRLGPNLTARRLNNTGLLFIVGDEHSGIGYLYGKEISYAGGKIAWIESMAVLPIYRRKGIGTALVKCFLSEMEKCSRIGCATPNPIAAYVLTRAFPGATYIGQCLKPPDLELMIKEVQSMCLDMRGCLIDVENLRIKTGFSPQSKYDHRGWEPKEPREEPAWWQTIQYLPNDFEALVIIDRLGRISRTSPATIRNQASARIQPSL